MWNITITPRFGDTDLLGHITNTVPAIWFETARNPLFRLLSPGDFLDQKIDPKTWPCIMAHTDFDFVDQLFFQYDVEIRTGLSHIGTKSFTIYHEAWQQGRLCVKGHAVAVWYDFTTNKTLPLPEDVKARLAEHLIEETRPR
jgi:acyl-CoA thioester hydrolase